MEDEIFKPSLEKQSTPEYSFEAGVSQTLDRVMHILRKQPYAILAFSASGDNVGKTELAKNLINKLFQRGIFCRSFHDPSEVQVEANHEKMVIIFDQMEWAPLECSFHRVIRENHDRDVANSFNKIGYDIEGIDLWIGIYRPDKPFVPRWRTGEKCAPIADIIVRNEGATDEYKLSACNKTS